MTLATLSWSLALVAVVGIQVTCGTNQLSQAIVALIEHTFVHRVNVLNIYVKCKEDPQRISYFTDLTNAVIRGLDEISVRVGWQRELPIDSERHFCVFGVDTLDALRELCSELRSRHYSIDGNTLIILRTFSRSYYDVLVDICEENLDMGIVNTNVVVEPLPGLVLMFTYFPFSKFSCHTVKPVLINTFKASKWQYDEMFPLKLRDLHGCPLICATWEDLPYFKILRGNNGEETYDGIEGRLLDFISARMNFKVQFYIMSEEEIEATVDEKGLIFDALFKNQVEFVVGAFHYKPTKEEDFFLPSNCYFLSKICIVLSSRREDFPPSTKLVLPFTLCLWLFVLAYFGVGILVSLTANHMPHDMRNFILGSGNDAPVYNMFYTALGGAVHRAPRRNFARFLLFIWLILWLVLRSAYQSALFHFIRTDLLQPLPDSVEDILEANYEILLSPTTFEALQYAPAIRAASRFLNGSEVDNFPMLPNEQRKIAILTPYEYFGYFRKLNRERSDEFYIPREHIFTQQLSIYMKKSSFLLNEFNARIAEYIAVGLQDKWKRSVIDLESRTTKKETSTFRNMTMEEITGAIEIFILGNVISFAVFTVELFSYHFCFEDVVERFKRI